MHNIRSLGPRGGHVVIGDLSALNKLAEETRSASLPRSGHIADTVAYIQDWVSREALNFLDNGDRRRIPFAEAQLYNLLAHLREVHRGYLGDVLDRYDRFSVQVADHFYLRHLPDRTEVVFEHKGVEMYAHKFYAKTRLIPSFGRHMLRQGLAIVSLTSTLHRRSYKFPVMLLDRG